jgi:hypothetical protein
MAKARFRPLGGIAEAKRRHSKIPYHGLQLALFRDPVSNFNRFSFFCSFRSKKMTKGDSGISAARGNRRFEMAVPLEYPSAVSAVISHSRLLNIDLTVIQL